MYSNNNITCDEIKIYDPNEEIRFGRELKNGLYELGICPSNYTHVPPTHGKIKEFIGCKVAEEGKSRIDFPTVVSLNKPDEDYFLLGRINPITNLFSPAYLGKAGPQYDKYFPQPDPNFPTPATYTRFVDRYLDRYWTYKIKNFPGKELCFSVYHGLLMLGYADKLKKEFYPVFV